MVWSFAKAKLLLILNFCQSVIAEKLVNMLVTVSESAKTYLKSVCPEGHVTLSVKGGGCSGMQYVWGLSKDSTDDSVNWSDPIEDILVVDPIAEMFLLGSEIDYVQELGGSFLKVKNPIATAQCGCGESFSA